LRWKAAAIPATACRIDQPLRQIFPIDERRLFATMPGGMDGPSGFGAKLISVFADPNQPGRSRHQGLVVAFDPDSGAVRCAADAEAVTARAIMASRIAAMQPG